MNWIASLYLGLGAIQLFTALSFGLLTRRSALVTGQATFGWITVALGLSSIFHFAEMSASSAHESARWQAWIFASHYASLVAFIPFARTYFGLKRTSAQVRLSLVFIAAATLPILAGFAFDPSVILVDASPIVPGPERPATRLTTTGIACALVGFIGFGAAWAPRVREVARTSSVRDLAIVMSFTTAAYTADFLHLAMGLRAVPLAPISALAFSMALSLLILGRYLDVRSDIERHAAELRLQYEQIALLETEIDKKEPLAIVGELSGVIARQIQSPVATLREATADLRIEGLSRDEWTHTLGVLDRETLRLNRLISDLLTYARPIEPQMEMLGVEEVWRDALESFERSTGRRLELHMDVAPEVASIEGDPRLLSVATLLLLENAASHLAAGDSITIRAQPYEREGRELLRLEVSDSGRWLASVAKLSFNAFRRSRTPGITALELGIIEKILLAHEATFLFEKHADGSTIGLAYFPVRQSAEARPS